MGLSASSAHDMPRVLHVIGRMPPHGAQRQLVGMLRAAHGRYWNATLCVLRSGYALSNQLAASGVPVVEFSASRGSGVMAAIRLRRLALGSDFDVVHSSLWGCNAVARLAVLSRDRPTVVISELSVENWRGRFRRIVDRALRPLTDLYIGNSTDVTDFICSAHGIRDEHVRIIRNGLDANVFYRRRAEWRTTGPLRIGCLGRLIPDKGFEVMIRALPWILERRDARLLIAGEGHDRSRLESAAAGLPVDFLGLLATPEEVADFLRSLDVFVMPSRYEGLPNAVLEALSCGVPIVATSVPGMAEAALGHAILVPADDPAALAAAVASVFERESEPPAGIQLPTFDDAARAHLEAFRSAILRRTASSERASAATM